MNGSPHAHVIDVTDGTFQQAVLEESRQRPVIVDFWAPWCGPCRALSPVLEKLAREGEGRFLLAKVNTDESSRAAGEFGVRGIPAVFAIQDGEVVDSFTGAIGEREVRAFLERVAPSPLEAAARDGLAALAAKDDARAAALLEEVRAAKPADPRALVGLALVHARAGRLDEARGLLDACAQIPDALRGLAAQARTLAEAAGGDVEQARAAVAQSPTDVDAVLRLAALLYAGGAAKDAFDALLEGVRRVKGPRRDELRKRLVELFDAEGPRTPLVEEARSRLASLWFS